MENVFNESVTYSSIFNKTSGIANIDALIVTDLTATNIIDTSLTPNKFIATDGTSTLVSRELIGTTDQVNINTAGTTTTLSLPQNIATTSAPTFNNLTLNGLTVSKFVASDGSKQLVSQNLQGTTDQVNINTVGTTTTLSLPQNIAQDSDVEFGTIKIQSTNINTLPDYLLAWNTGNLEVEGCMLSTTNQPYNVVIRDVSGNFKTNNITVESLPASNIVATDTNKNLTFRALAGTTNQISVNTIGNTTILSTPQDIATTSTPSFTSSIFTGQYIYGGSTSNKLFLPTANNDSLVPKDTLTYMRQKYLMGEECGFYAKLDSTKIVALNPAGSASGVTTTLGFMSTANRLIFAPDASCTLLGDNDTTARTIAGQFTFSQAVKVSPTSNQIILGTTNTVTINSTAPAASRTYTIPDAGTNSSFVMTDSNQTINGSKTFSTGITTKLPSITLTGTTPSLATGTFYGLQITNASAGTFATGLFSISDSDGFGTVPLRGFTSGLIKTRGIAVSNASNANLISISSAVPAASRTYTIPDAGANANIVLTAGTNNAVTATALASTTAQFYKSSVTTAYTGSSTLSAADLISGFIQFTTNVAGVTLTFPTGTQIETAVSAYVTPYNGLTFDFCFWNFNVNAVTLASNTGIGFQILPSTSQSGQTSKLYKLIRTSANNYVVYSLN